MLDQKKDELGKRSELTDNQRARLACVQQRCGVDDFINPNMADTPCHLAEHGFARFAPDGHMIPAEPQ